MTNEEAINIFEIDKHTSGNWTEADELALTALRAQQEHSKGCEYCDLSSGDVGATMNTTGDDFVMVQGDDSVSIATDDNYFRILKINFCPMCGRPLKEAQREH